MKHIFVLAFMFPIIALGQENYDQRFYCKEQERFLSDEEFINLALDYELEKKLNNYRWDHALPDGYSIGNIDEFLKNNPNCCRAIRDPDVLDSADRSWLDRWLHGEQVMISILILPDSPEERVLNLNYFTDECGIPFTDRSYGFTYVY